MGRKVKKILITWGILVCLIIIIVVGEEVRKKIGNIPIPWSIFKILAFMVGIYSVLRFLVDVLDREINFFEWKATRIWEDVQDNVKTNITHYIEVNKGASQYALPTVVWGQLISIYNQDAEVIHKILEIMDKVYEQVRKNDLMQVIFSYILLNNCGNNEIAEFFEKNQGLKGQCEEISKGLAHSEIKEFSNNVRELDDKLILGLLHACLPNNSILKDDIIYTLRMVLGSFQRDIVDKNTKDDREIILKFILMVPLIEEKMRRANIKNCDITNNINSIKDSKYLRDIVKKSHQQIMAYLNMDNINYQQFEQFALHASILCVYYDKMSWLERNHLYREVRVRNRKHHRYYDSDERAILLILYAAPLQMFKKEGNLMYDLAVLACMCVDNFPQI